MIDEPPALLSVDASIPITQGSSSVMILSQAMRKESNHFNRRHIKGEKRRRFALKNCPPLSFKELLNPVATVALTE